MEAFPTLETERLRLREIVIGDAPDLLAMHGDTQAMKWFGIDPMTELAEAQALVDTFAEGRTHASPATRWGLQFKHQESLVGNVGLYKWNRAWKSCSLGFALAPAGWGQGLMHETLAAILAWGFAQMQLNRVEATVHPDNLACLKLLKRLGFEEEGRLREAGFWQGQHQDLQVLSLLRADFN